MERTIRLDDGSQTVLESWGSVGPAVLCVHGITSSRKSWVRLAQRLDGRYRVFAYDQRGHGDAHACAGPMSHARTVADLRQVAAAVGEPVHLVGHSWGGAVALIGGREPFALKVIAIDPMIRVERDSWRVEYLDDAEQDLSLPWPTLEQRLRERHAGWHPLDVEGKLHAVHAMKAPSIGRLGSDNKADEGGWDLLGLLTDYPKPLLVLAAGPTDSVIAQNDLAYLRARGGSNLTVCVFEGEGHNLHRTAFEQFARAVENFIG